MFALVQQVLLELIVVPVFHYTGGRNVNPARIANRETVTSLLVNFYYKLIKTSESIQSNHNRTEICNDFTKNMS